MPDWFKKWPYKCIKFGYEWHNGLYNSIWNFLSVFHSTWISKYWINLYFSNDYLNMRQSKCNGKYSIYFIILMHYFVEAIAGFRFFSITQTCKLLSVWQFSKIKQLFYNWYAFVIAKSSNTISLNVLIL